MPAEDRPQTITVLFVGQWGQHAANRVKVQIGIDSKKESLAVFFFRCRLLTHVLA